MIYFFGTSHAATHLRNAAALRGVPIAATPELADVLFVSEDTPTDATGKRDLVPIIDLMNQALDYGKQVVLTSQVPPGFTRSFGKDNIFHQAETLRILDAEKRAFAPEQIIVGGVERAKDAYLDYLHAFRCPIIWTTWENAEFSKIAINMFLAAQVDCTNRLAAAAGKVGAHWGTVKWALQNDKRIGPHAYLEPGRWQDSTHLLRDAVTLAEIERAL